MFTRYVSHHAQLHFCTDTLQRHSLPAPEGYEQLLSALSLTCYAVIHFILSLLLFVFFFLSGLLCSAIYEFG
jgi:hypothetical protein